MSTNDDKALHLRKQVAAYIKHEWAHVTADQQSQLIEQTLKHPDCVTTPLPNCDDPTSESCQLMIGFSTRKIVAAQPHLVAAAPTGKDIINALVAEHRAQFGTEFDPGTKMETLKRVGAMSPWQLIQEAKRLGITLKPATPKQTAEEIEAAQSSPAKPRLFRDMTPEELDGVVRARLGIEPHQLTATKRKSYHDSLKASDPKPHEAHTAVDKAATSGVLGRQLSPTERINAHRRAQAAKGGC